MDAAGNLYGTTVNGGAHGESGTVFELTPNATKTGWMETVLYSFCAQTNCTDGGGPFAGVIMDAAGNLYGTTLGGGAHGNSGTVFELTPNADKTKWTETVLYSFCAKTNCTDGGGPVSGLSGPSRNLFLVDRSIVNEPASGLGFAGPNAVLIMDKAGNLYGTTLGGGAHGNYGTVFELTPNATRTKWTETVLYSFCASFFGCSDGRNPEARLIMGKSGRLYGTTGLGGAGEVGAVFELTANAAKTEWTETVLYSFCAQAPDKCTDGFPPRAGLIIDEMGKLYGTTAFGGTHAENVFYGGTVYELTPPP